jgi:hypothetical protein
MVIQRFRAEALAALGEEKCINVRHCEGGASLP